MKIAIVVALAGTVAGCASSPADYAASLSSQDPKWSSPQCQKARQDASDYAAREKKHPGWESSLLLGPYSLALVASIKDHEREQRRLFAREVHLQCSSSPLPRNLERATAPTAATKYP